MKSTNAQVEPRVVTLAELCEALADGTLPSEQEDGYYVVTKRALDRYTQPYDLVKVIVERASRRELAAVS